MTHNTVTVLLVAAAASGWLLWAIEVFGKTGRTDLAMRIAMALRKAEYAHYDGDSRKLWVIDQMVRELTGCHAHLMETTDEYGSKYFYEVLTPSKEYVDFVRAYRAGEDGPYTYDWSEGTPP